MAIGMTKITNSVIETTEPVAAASIEWASATGGAVLNAGSGEIFQEIQIQVSVVFNASATGDANLHIRYSSDDGTTKDSEGLNTFARVIGCDPGNTVIITHHVYGVFDYMDVGMENEDTSYALNWSAKYSGIKITGMN